MRSRIDCARRETEHALRQIVSGEEERRAAEERRQRLREEARSHGAADDELRRNFPPPRPHASDRTLAESRREIEELGEAMPQEKALADLAALPAATVVQYNDAVHLRRVLREWRALLEDARAQAVAAMPSVMLVLAERTAALEREADEAHQRAISTVASYRDDMESAGKSTRHVPQIIGPIESLPADERLAIDALVAMRIEQIDAFVATVKAQTADAWRAAYGTGGSPEGQIFSL